MNEKEKYGIATACITKYLHIATIPFNLSQSAYKAPYYYYDCPNSRARKGGEGGEWEYVRI